MYISTDGLLRDCDENGTIKSTHEVKDVDYYIYYGPM